MKDIMTKEAIPEGDEVLADFPMSGELMKPLTPEQIQAVFEMMKKTND